PETRWKTPLPFPVHVVARVRSDDIFSRSTLTSEYRYRHGYWDGVEREFCGFGRVDQRDAQMFAELPTSHSPPTETRTWFHQGAVGDRFTGWYELDLSDEYWQGDRESLPRSAASEALLARLPSD